LGDPDLGFISTSGIVGGCISLGVGAGYACRQRGEGAIAAVFFGDGALEEGISFEALNIASLWRLPVLFVCENNSSGSWAPGQGYPTLVHASSDLCSIAKSLNIATMRVDGADVSAVHSAATEAIGVCRAGKGPVFLEAVTRRWPGNNPLWPVSVTGATDLRMATGEIAPPGEHAGWLSHHDPVLRLAGSLASASREAARLASLDAAVRRRIEDAVKFALASPFPASETAFERVFA
jgi:pyruvate dehydrogenase E1 component alpha subunit